MDVILVAPEEISLRDKVLFRENNVKSDYENLTAGNVNFLFVKFLKDNLGIASLAAYLRQYGYTVQMVNIYLDNISVDALTDRILMENPEIVGISLLYDLHAFSACKIVKELRRKGYKGHITLGGPFITLTYDVFLKGIPEIDSVIRGDGEVTLLELLKKIKGRENWRDIAGIAFIQGDRLILNGNGKYENNLSCLPAVARDLYENLANRLECTHMRLKVASIYTSRGCGGRCTYCSAPELGKLVIEKWRYRPVQSVIDEIKYLVTRFGVEYINIIDENFFGYGKNGINRLYDLAQGIIKSGVRVKFWAEIRVDIDFDEELFSLLKKAGLQDVLLGLESGSQSTLNRWRKGTTVEQNMKAVEFIRKKGFRLEPSLIMVDPYTNLEEFKDTVNFIVKSKLCKTAFPLNLFNQLIVFPGTEIEKKLIDDHIIPEVNLDAISYISDDDNELFEFCRNASTRSYDIIDPVMRTLWETLVYYTNRLTFLTDEAVPLFMGNYRKRFKDLKKDDKQRENIKLLKISKWRKNIWKLTQKLLEVSIECADKSYKNTEQLKDVLVNEFERTVKEYNGECLGEVLSLTAFHQLLIRMEEGDYGS